MKHIFVADLTQNKEELTGVYLLKHLAVMEAKDGKNYLNLVLTDSTGDIEARFWGAEGPELASHIKKGDFIKVSGKVNFYQGRKQFIVNYFGKAEEGSFNPDDYVVKSTRPPEEMYTRLLSMVDGLTDVYIRDLLKLILTDTEVSRRLKLWQAGKTIHHAYQSGLLEHILSCSELALILSKHYNVNVNYVVAGCILHDLCKIYELSSGTVVDYTEEGKLVGHLAKGLEIIDRYTYRIKDFPYNTKLHLKHIILSHHGEYNYGSPKLPHTSEAYLVHLIDFMDSKMNSVETIKRFDTTPGHWSGFVKHLDRIIYKDELPFYPDYIPDEERERNSTHKTQAHHKPEKEVKSHAPKAEGKEIKQNLGKLLGGLKID